MHNSTDNHMQKAWEVLSSGPKTKSELCRGFATAANKVTEKTVTNRLGEIHRQIRYRTTSKAKQNAFVVLDDVGNGVRRYAIMPRSVRERNSITYGGKKYTRSERNRLRSGGYTAEIFER